jgi:hypothetical protein
LKKEGKDMKSFFKTDDGEGPYEYIRRVYGVLLTQSPIRVYV